MDLVKLRCEMTVKGREWFKGVAKTGRVNPNILFINSDDSMLTVTIDDEVIRLGEVRQPDKTRIFKSAQSAWNEVERLGFIKAEFISTINLQKSAGNPCDYP